MSTHETPRRAWAQNSSHFHSHNPLAAQIHCARVTVNSNLQLSPTRAACRKPPRRDLKSLPKAHLHLHLGTSGRGATLRCLCEKLTALTRTVPRPPHLENKASDLRADLERTKAKGDQRGVKKRQQQLDHLEQGIVWPALDSDPAAIDARPMGFRGFTEITAIQQLAISCANTTGDPTETLCGLIRELCEDAVAEGIRSFEVSVVITGTNSNRFLKLAAAINEAEAAHPEVGVGLVPSISRGQHVNASDVQKHADNLHKLIEVCHGEESTRLGLRQRIVGLGLLGREAEGNFADLFGPCFELARAEGWPAVPHAGEMVGAEQGPKSVRAALAIGAKRIGHGILAVHSPELLARLKAEDVCCEVCPISNRHLGFVPSLKEHPLPTLLAAGVPCCISADDPATFGAENAHGLLREFEVCRDYLGMEDAQLAQLAKASFQYSSCPPSVRAKALDDIERWAAQAYV